jgi:anti-anti-sigma factor
LSFSAIR